MALFEIGGDQLIPFRRVQAGPELYESEIEDLLWDNIDAFTGEPLFPIARQPRLANGLQPDVLAVNGEGRVFVIEIKRDIDRRQLAQCLEYAGWARRTNLDELATLFHGGETEFFSAWQEFTDTSAPTLIRRPPELVLVARDFDDRTDSALAYLTENDLPVTVLRVVLYEDQDGRRFLDVASEHEPEFASGTAATAGTSGTEGPARFEIEGRRIALSDLIEAGLLAVREVLVWERPRLGVTYRATVGEKGTLRLEDGREFSSPSRAAIEVAEIPAMDGWLVWRNGEGERLRDLRSKLIESDPEPCQPDSEE